MANDPIGARRWAIAEGYLRSWSSGTAPQMKSHETLCVLNRLDSRQAENALMTTIAFAG